MQGISKLVSAATAPSLRSLSAQELRPSGGTGLPRLAPDSEPGPLAMHHRPGRVVLVDDDPDFVEMLALTLPKHWSIEGFSRPSQCLVALQNEPRAWESDLWTQQEIVNLQHRGAPLVPQVLRYFETTLDRRAIASVIVVDYMMPGLTGLELLGELPEHQAKRVLLTGTVDESLAHRAFNGGLIDHFVVKQSSTFRQNLVDAVERLTALPNQRYQQLWWSTLRQDQATVLLNRELAGEISAFLHSRFMEWIVIGQPFGAVALDRAGQAYWLQLEQRERLGELAELAAAEAPGSEHLDAIRRGELLCDVELRRAMGLRGTNVVSPLAVGSAGELLAAVHPIDGQGVFKARSFLGTRSVNESSY